MSVPQYIGDAITLTATAAGTPIPATTVGTAFQAGTWRLGDGLELYLYAASDTAIALIPVYESRGITNE